MKTPPRAALAALFAISAASPARAAELDLTRTSVLHFMSEMRTEHGFEPTDVANILRSVQTQPRIVELMDRPAERSLAWWEYRARFLQDERIDAGVQVWQQHRDTLDRISAESGVPPQYLVAITGVETYYGRITGNYRVLDALATLAFDFPRRASYFRGELTQFLLLAREEGVDPRTLKGSYAGAFGIAQFMPSSYRRLAVDGDGDGRRDLWEWGPDVFASIAHYFKQNGWRAGEPVLSDASLQTPAEVPEKTEIALKDTVQSLRNRGYVFDTPLPASARAMLVPANQQASTGWRVGYQNFYVITRYNRSVLYAMAVNDLADAIAARYRALPPPDATVADASPAPASPQSANPLSVPTPAATAPSLPGTSVAQ